MGGVVQQPSLSLAALRAKPAARPERAITICLKPDLVAEVQMLTAELSTLPNPQPVNAEDRDGAPARQGGEHPRSAAIRARLKDLLAEIAEHEGELRLRAIADGEWRQWTNAHPAREEGKPGHQRDAEVAAGYCNADDLIDDLARYAYAWNGEPLAPGDWDILAASMGGPDFKGAAQAVVSMHERRLDFPQWRSALSADLTRLNDFVSPASTTSPPPSSSDGSSPSSTSTSTPTATLPA